MEQALTANQMIVGILTTIIGWGGFIAVLVVLRNFIIAGITQAMMAYLFRANDTNFTRLIVRRLTDGDYADAKELYLGLKEKFEASSSESEVL